MNNVSTTNYPGTGSWRGMSAWGGILLFIIGLLIGIFAFKPYWQRSARIDENTLPQKTAALSVAAQPAMATAPSTEGATPSDQPDGWNPWWQVQQTQKQVDQAFQQSSPQFASGTNLNNVQRQFGDLQKQIDQIFQESFPQLNNAVGQDIAFTKPGYGTSMDVRDLKNKYQVCAFLPDTKPSDVHVNLKGDELKVDMTKQVTEKPTAKNGETALNAWGNYEEVVRLAGPVKDGQMTVQRLPHELIISVPKA